MFIAISVALYVTAFVLLRTYFPDCFSGTLSDDPVQCHALEQAHNEGIINVEAVYEVGEVLYFQLSQADFVTEEQRQFLIEQARVKLDGYPDLSIVPGWFEYCHGVALEVALTCILESTFQGSRGGVVLWSDPNRSVSFRPGGDAMRRQTRGWATYRQVWPHRVARQAQIARGPGNFDVSEVDVTNFPEVTCGSQNSHSSCRNWLRNPGLGIGGWHGGEGSWSTHYVQVKVTGDDPNAEAAARQRLIQRYGFDNGELLVTIPVKHGFGELLRWSVILDRFAYVSGNTIGIMGAQVSTNHGWPGVLHVSGSAPQIPDELPPSVDRDSLLRDTILVWAVDPQMVADALPELLPQLGIPTDAVGVIAPTDLATTERGGTLDAGWEAGGLRIISWLELDSRSPVLAWMVPAGTVAVVLALAGFVVVWLRHRRANRADAAPIPNVDAMG